MKSHSEVTDHFSNAVLVSSSPLNQSDKTYVFMIRVLHGGVKLKHKKAIIGNNIVHHEFYRELCLTSVR